MKKKDAVVVIGHRDEVSDRINKELNLLRREIVGAGFNSSKRIRTTRQYERFLLGCHAEINSFDKRIIKL